MKRIWTFFRAWRRHRILRRLVEVDMELQLAQYGYDTSLWEDEECEIIRLQKEMTRLEEKLSRLV